MSPVLPLASIDAPQAHVAQAFRPPVHTLPTSFADLVAQGIGNVEQKVRNADALVRAFALDDSIPVHRVTIALEEARIAVEMALQVRTRLVEAYRDIMNMQL